MSKCNKTGFRQTTKTRVMHEPSLVRHKTVGPGCDLWGVQLRRPTSLPVTTTKVTPRPEDRPKTTTDQSRSGPGGQGGKKRIPILGPTRQQTKIYLKNRRKHRRHNVVPVGGAEEKVPVTEKINPSGLPVFDTKAANTVLIDADMQIKSGYPTIAASSMMARRRRSETFDELGFSPDVRFFSELVKPIQYRWKFQHDKNKIILPSKHGYHPRSKSPTFQRLVEATEKLQIIMEHDSGMGSFEKDDDLETHSQLTPDDPVSGESDPPSVKPSVYSMPPVKPIELQSYTRPIPKYKLAPDSNNKLERNEAESDEENNVLENELDNEDEDFVETPSQFKSTLVHQPEFKVDFKKMDTHSELHLFLPLIDDGPVLNESHTRTKSYKHTSKVSLPSIDHINRSKSEDKLTSKKERKYTEHRKKKKKSRPRIKSGNDDNEVKDILNDVTTLISMKQEEKSDYHTASMCMFENCSYHPRHNKSNRIRQA